MTLATHCVWLESMAPILLLASLESQNALEILKIAYNAQNYSETQVLVLIVLFGSKRSKHCTKLSKKA